MSLFIKMVCESRTGGVPGSTGVPVCRAKAPPLGGCDSRPASVVPAGSHRNGCGGNEAVEAFDSPQGTRRACRPSRAVNAEQAPTTANAQAAPTGTGRRPPSGGEANDTSTLLIAPGSWRQQAWTREGGPHGKPRSVVGSGPGQRRCREARSRSVGVAQRGVVPARPWNSAGGKAPWSGRSARRSARGVMGDESANTEGVSRSSGRHCMRKRRRSPSVGSISSTTRWTGRMCWPMRTSAVARRGERRESTARPSRPSRRRGWSGGLGSGRRS